VKPQISIEDTFENEEELAESKPKIASTEGTSGEILQRITESTVLIQKQMSQRRELIDQHGITHHDVQNSI
jgi:hypothetical protein